MNVPVYNAISFQRELRTGRTNPCIFICEAAEGEDPVEYVVKLKAGIESGKTGLSAELIASLLADELDIPTPKPTLIAINPEFPEAIPNPELAAKIRGSIGLNFGSKMITEGYGTWLQGKSIPTGLKALAAEIFVFDAFIQNPDRREDKPNILMKGSELFIIDHELGFSFIYDIVQRRSPWKVSELNFLTKHLFYNKLKGQALNYDRVIGVIESITHDKVREIIGCVPPEWRGPMLPRIENHLCEIVEHVNEFIDEIRRVLA